MVETLAGRPDALRAGTGEVADGLAGVALVGLVERLERLVHEVVLVEQEGRSLALAAPAHRSTPVTVTSTERTGSPVMPTTAAATCSRTSAAARRNGTP